MHSHRIEGHKTYANLINGREKMRYPKITHLYKYCTYNINSLYLLINRKIWFSNPESFNDPFDCKYNFKGEVDRAEFEEYSNNHNPKKMMELKNIIRNGEEEDVYNEIYRRLLEEVNEGLKNAGVFCLSQHNDNVLMWSHYSDGHKGFCIEFERSKNNELGNYERARPVKYIPHDYQKVTVFNKKAYDMKFYTKAYNWKYEGEWRLVNDKYNETGSFPGKITSIIFGLRMNDHHKKTIKEILSDMSHIKYPEVKKVPNQYKIKIIDK